MEKKQRIFVPQMYISEKDFGDGKVLLDISIGKEAMIDFLHKYSNDKGQLKLSCWKKKEADKYGTHNAELNTWQPPKQSERREEEPDLPF
jgi:hypothetical protein